MVLGYNPRLGPFKCLRMPPNLYNRYYLLRFNWNKIQRVLLGWVKKLLYWVWVTNKHNMNGDSRVLAGTAILSVLNNYYSWPYVIQGYHISTHRGGVWLGFTSPRWQSLGQPVHTKLCKTIPRSQNKRYVCIYLQHCLNCIPYQKTSL